MHHARAKVILIMHDLTIRTLPKYYISYNWEQLTTDKHWNPELFKRFKRAVEVWDYSHLNIEKLALIGIEAKYLPMLYHEPTPNRYFITDNPDDVAAKTVDVLFFGAQNNRRQEKLAIVEKIYAKNPTKYSFQTSLHGADLLPLLKQSKIGTFSSINNHKQVSICITTVV
jgi:hypothetical protein